MSLRRRVMGAGEGEKLYRILEAEGEYTPSSNVSSITISGLPFRPNSAWVYHTPNGVNSVSLCGQIGTFAVHGRTNTGGTTNTIGSASPTATMVSPFNLDDVTAYSAAMTFGANSFTAKMYASNMEFCFKAGEVYHWKAYRIEEV